MMFISTSDDSTYILNIMKLNPIRQSGRINRGCLKNGFWISFMLDVPIVQKRPKFGGAICEQPRV